MKRLLLALTAIVATPVLADHDGVGESGSYYVDADVVQVEPIVNRRIVRTPHEVCDQPMRYTRRDRDALRRDEYAPGPGPAIIGGILGGLIGNQFGHHGGRGALTIAGALAGASIAGAVARENHRDVRRDPLDGCRTVVDEKLVTSAHSYRVTYAYHGRQFVKEMDSYPGEQIPIRVQVSPQF